ARVRGEAAAAHARAGGPRHHARRDPDRGLDHLRGRRVPRHGLPGPRVPGRHHRLGQPVRPQRRPGVRPRGGGGGRGEGPGGRHVLGRPLRQGRGPFRPRVGARHAQGGPLPQGGRRARERLLRPDGGGRARRAPGRGGRVMGGAGLALFRFLAETDLEDLPKPVVEVARLAALDWWGVSVAGAAEPVARRLGEVLSEPAGPASVLGTDRTASPMAAALRNGTAAHALDYDDVHLDLPGHLTAPILPALVALGETRRLGGGRVLGALVLGAEVTCRVARALAPGHYRAGWHATATLG